MLKKLPFITSFMVWLAPLTVLAQAKVATGDLSSYIKSIIDFLNATILPAIIAVAFLVFIWGVFQYFILGAEDQEKRDTGLTYIKYGIIGFVLMLTIVGIVNLLANATGFTNKDVLPIPKLPGIN